MHRTIAPNVLPPLSLSGVARSRKGRTVQGGNQEGAAKKDAITTKIGLIKRHQVYLATFGGRLNCTPPAVASPGFGVRRGTKLRENNLWIHKKYYEIHAVNSDKAIDLYIVLLGIGNHMKWNVRVCAALK